MNCPVCNSSQTKIVEYSGKLAYMGKWLHCKRCGTHTQLNESERMSLANSKNCGNPEEKSSLREGVTKPVALKTRPSLSRDNSSVQKDGVEQK